VNTRETYDWIRVAGFISFIPFALISGPLAGYILGGFLAEKFHTSYYLTGALIIIGGIGSVYQTFQIIIKVIKSGNKMK